MCAVPLFFHVRSCLFAFWKWRLQQTSIRPQAVSPLKCDCLHKGNVVGTYNQTPFPTKSLDARKNWNFIITVWRIGFHKYYGTSSPSLKIILGIFIRMSTRLPTHCSSNRRWRTLNLSTYHGHATCTVHSTSSRHAEGYQDVHCWGDRYLRLHQTTLI